MFGWLVILNQRYHLLSNLYKIRHGNTDASQKNTCRKKTVFRGTLPRSEWENILLMAVLASPSGQNNNVDIYIALRALPLKAYPERVARIPLLVSDINLQRNIILSLFSKL